MSPNELLDENHEAVGVSDFGDDISDTCEVCGFAVGWVDDHFGHDTVATSDEVKLWIGSVSCDWDGKDEGYGACGILGCLDCV